MDEDEKRSLVKRYLAAYNGFDIDGMMELIHSILLSYTLSHTSPFHTQLLRR